MSIMEKVKNAAGRYRGGGREFVEIECDVKHGRRIWRPDHYPVWADQPALFRVDGSGRVYKRRIRLRIQGPPNAEGAFVIVLYDGLLWAIAERTGEVGRLVHRRGILPLIFEAID